MQGSDSQGNGPALFRVEAWSSGLVRRALASLLLLVVASAGLYVVYRTIENGIDSPMEVLTIAVVLGFSVLFGVPGASTLIRCASRSARILELHPDGLVLPANGPLMWKSREERQAAFDQIEKIELVGARIGRGSRRRIGTIELTLRAAGKVTLRGLIDPENLLNEVVKRSSTVRQA